MVFNEKPEDVNTRLFFIYAYDSRMLRVSYKYLIQYAYHTSVVRVSHA